MMEKMSTGLDVYLDVGEKMSNVQELASEELLRQLLNASERRTPTTPPPSDTWSRFSPGELIQGNEREGMDDALEHMV